MNFHRNTFCGAVIDRSYRPDVDGLRAIEVILVLLFHFEVPGFPGGYIGVDVFFVISGFLISRLIVADLADGKFSFADFYRRRVRRLLPAYLVTVAITLLFGTLLLHPIHLEDLGRATVFATASLSNFAFWTESGYFGTSAYFKPLLHTWSLAVEEQYYLIWPAILWFCFSRARWGGTPALVAAAIFTSALFASQLMIGIDSTAAFYLVPFRMFEFIIGFSLIMLPVISISRPIISDALFCAGMALIVACAILYDATTPFPGLMALLPCIGTWLVIAARPTRHLSYVLNNRVAVRVGLLSYSLYLVHWPLLVYYRYIVFRDLMLIETIALLITSFLIAFLLWWLVENPIHKPSTRSRKLFPANFVIISAAAASLFVMFVAANSWGDHGWPSRLTRAQLAFSKALDDVPGAECQMDVTRNQTLPCAFGAKLTGPIEVVLIGDSHAAHVRAALDPILKNLGLTGGHRSIGGCAPLVDTYTIGLTVKQIDKCREINDASFAFAMRDEVKVVVLAARWSFYTEATSSGFEKLNPYPLVHDRDDPRSNSRVVFEQALFETVQRLVRAGKKVVLIGQVPEIGIDPVICLGRPSLMGFSSDRRCRYHSKADALERLAFSNDLLKTVSETYPKSAFVSLPSDEFCQIKNDYCDILVGKVLAYRDDDHLSLSGSRRLSQFLSAPLESFLTTH